MLKRIAVPVVTFLGGLLIGASVSPMGGKQVLARARLAEASIHPVKEPEEYPYGRFAWVLDGEGNRIELWEPPESEGQ